MIPQEVQAEVLKEFSSMAVQAGTALRGGSEFVQGTLEKAVGAGRASEVLAGVAPTGSAAMKGLGEMDARQIFNSIRDEQAQTIAVILSHLPPGKTAQVFSLLSMERREQVLERLATLGPAPVEVVERMVELVMAKAGVNEPRALRQSGGVKRAAEVLNAMEKTQSKTLLARIEQRNPELTQAIRQKMFTFEELSTLDAQTLQRILREVDMRELAVALKSASEGLKSLLLGSISKRAAETIKEEIAYMASVKPREVEAAQLRIIDVVRRLEADGEIELNDFEYEAT